MLSQRKALVLVTLVLLCCALLNTRWTGWLAGPVAHTVNTLQRPADWLASGIGSNPAVDYPDHSEEQEGDLLEKTRIELEKERAQNAALWEENRLLVEQIKAFEAITLDRDMASIRMVEARVSRFDNDPNNPTFYVLRGSLHGLKRDAPVAYRANLIGFVTDSIGPANATVDLISRKGFSIGVNIMYPPRPGDKPGQEPDPGWPFKTRVESDGKGKFFFETKKKIADGLRPGDYVRAADTILESANGFLIGRIEAITESKDDPLNLSRVTVKPSVPIGPQRTVTILTERTD